jgi:hypothetical protein
LVNSSWPTPFVRVSPAGSRAIQKLAERRIFILVGEETIDRLPSLGAVESARTDFSSASTTEKPLILDTQVRDTAGRLSSLQKSFETRFASLQQSHEPRLTALRQSGREADARLTSLQKSYESLFTSVQQSARETDSRLTSLQHSHEELSGIVASRTSSLSEDISGVSELQREFCSEFLTVHSETDTRSPLFEEANNVFHPFFYDTSLQGDEARLDMVREYAACFGTIPGQLFDETPPARDFSVSLATARQVLSLNRSLLTLSCERGSLLTVDEHLGFCVSHSAETIRGRLI